MGEKTEYEGVIVVFDDMLDSNRKRTDHVYAGGQHKGLDVKYGSHSTLIWREKQQG